MLNTLVLLLKCGA